MLTSALIVRCCVMLTSALIVRCCVMLTSALIVRCCVMLTSAIMVYFCPSCTPVSLLQVLARFAVFVEEILVLLGNSDKLNVSVVAEQIVQFEEEVAQVW